MRKNISPLVRMQILRRDSFKCIYCGATAENDTLEIDHIIPASKGGTNDPGNLAVACRTCNIGKGNKSVIPVCDEDVGVFVNSTDAFAPIPPRAFREEHRDDPATPWLEILRKFWPVVIESPPASDTGFTPTFRCRHRHNSDIGADVDFLVVPWRPFNKFTDQEKEQIRLAVCSGRDGRKTAVIMGTPGVFFGVLINGASENGTPKGRIIDHFIEVAGRWQNAAWWPQFGSFQDLREPYRACPRQLAVMDWDREKEEIVGVYASIDGMGVWNGV